MKPNYINEYIYSLKMSDSSRLITSNFWKRVNKFENEINKNIESGYTKNEFIALLSSLNNANISGFITCKSSIKKYVEYLCKNSVIGYECLENIKSVKYDDIHFGYTFEHKFFKNFQELQDTIQLCLTEAERVDNRIFATQITAIYMAWCGVKLEDALLIKKDDVKQNQIITNEGIIKPNKTIMQFINDYKEQTDYKSQARVIVKLKYVPSQWLFRSTKSEHIDSEKTMRIFIRNFGRYCCEKGSIFNYDKIYWSGVYNRAYIYECQNGRINYDDTQTIREVLKQEGSLQMIKSRLVSYRKYAQYFFGE